MKRLLLLLLIWAVVPAALLTQPAQAQMSPPRVIAHGAALNGANGMAFDPQGHLYIGSLMGRQIVVMDPDSGMVLDRLGAERGVEGADDITLGPDGKLYYTALLTGEIGRWDGAHSTVATGLFGCNPITFAPNGRLYVARDFFGTKGLYEVDPTGKQKPRAVLPDIEFFNAFNFGPDGWLYGPLFNKGQVVRVNVDDGQVRLVSEGFKTPASVRWHAGQMYVADQGTGTIYIVDRVSGTKTAYVTIELGLDNIAFHPQGRMFVSNANTGAIYEVTGPGKYRVVSKGGMAGAAGVAVLARPDGGESVFVNGPWTLTEFDGKTGAQRSLYNESLFIQPVVSSLGISSDGRSILMATGSNSNALQVWDPFAQKMITTIDKLAIPAYAIRFQGDYIVSELGTNPGQVTRVNAQNPQQRTKLAALGIPLGLAGNDRDLYAVDWLDGTVKQIYANGKLLGSPKIVASGLKGPEGVALERDGTLLVVEAAASRLIRVNPQTGVVTAVAEGLDLPVPGFWPVFWPMLYVNNVAVGPSGAIYIAGDRSNVLYRIEPTATR